MARWVRNPPSSRMAMIWIAIIVLCLAIAGAEHVWGWPDWLTVNGKGRFPK